MKKTDKRTQSAIVYCGPDIPFVARQFDSYSNGLPERLEQMAMASYAIAALIVPMERLAQTRAELMRQGSAMQNIFARAEEEIKRRR